MKSADRCKYHFQGSRCALVRDHQSAGDPAGIIHIDSVGRKWCDKDQMDGLKPDPRNARQPRKDLRRLIALSETVRRGNEQQKFFYRVALDNIAKFYRGESSGQPEGRTEQPETESPVEGPCPEGAARSCSGSCTGPDEDHGQLQEDRSCQGQGSCDRCVSECAQGA